MNFKKIMAGTAISIIMFGIAVGFDPNPNGYDTGYSSPGYTTAYSNTYCAIDGLFADYTHGAIPANLDIPRGQNGTNDNSVLCGNPQNQ